MDHARLSTVDATYERKHAGQRMAAARGWRAAAGELARLHGAGGNGMAGQIQDTVPELDRSTILAIERTRAAYERTMMAWIRTATSLITFGFTIYKFFQLEVPRHEERKYLVGPRQFAIAMVCIGLFSLLLATIEYRQNILALRSQIVDKQRSLAVITATLISGLGVIALVLMILRQ
jgi:putative membrane protein